MQAVLKHVIRDQKWSNETVPHNFGEPHNRTANPPGLNQHASAIDVCCPHKGSGDTIKSAFVTYGN